MYYLGIDLGGTNIAIGLVDKNGTIVCKGSVPTRRERDYQEIVKDMSILSLKLMKDSGIDIKNVECVGVGSPGIPNSKEGTIVYASTMGFKNVPLRTELQKYMSLPVFVDNDANCAALAESVFGAAKGVEHSITLTLGTGIGGGIVIKRKIYGGFNFGAAEFGHMVISVDGELCTCGRKGCWETYASATALVRQTRKAAIENPSSIINTICKDDASNIDAKTAFDALRQGDETANKVVSQFIKYLADGVTNVINILQPEVLAIGGGLSKEGEYLLKPLRKIVNKDSYSRNTVQTRIEAAKMGNDAGIVGAAMLGKYN